MANLPDCPTDTATLNADHYYNVFLECSGVTVATLAQFQTGLTAYAIKYEAAVFPALTSTFTYNQITGDFRTSFFNFLISYADDVEESAADSAGEVRISIKKTCCTGSTWESEQCR